MTPRTALLIAQHQLATRLRSQDPDGIPSLLVVEGTTESLKLPMPPFNMFKYIKSTSRAQTLNSPHRCPVFMATFPSIHLKYVLVKVLPQVLDVQCVSIHQAAGTERHDQTDGQYDYLSFCARYVAAIHLRSIYPAQQASREGQFKHLKKA
ncbi:hypothetical protein C8R43DRAFT_1004729 [Mycena crocata]|nr:hypothetical protein C8R43DRAFT_1004729 [Mycena crocata]